MSNNCRVLHPKTAPAIPLPSRNSKPSSLTSTRPNKSQAPLSLCPPPPPPPNAPSHLPTVLTPILDANNRRNLSSHPAQHPHPTNPPLPKSTPSKHLPPLYPAALSPPVTQRSSPPSLPQTTAQATAPPLRSLVAKQIAMRAGAPGLSLRMMKEGLRLSTGAGRRARRRTLVCHSFCWRG